MICTRSFGAISAYTQHVSDRQARASSCKAEVVSVQKDFYSVSLYWLDFTGQLWNEVLEGVSSLHAGAHELKICFKQPLISTLGIVQKRFEDLLLIAQMLDVSAVFLCSTRDIWLFMSGGPLKKDEKGH